MNSFNSSGDHPEISQRLSPEDVLLQAFSYFHRDEISLGEFIQISITSVTQGIPSIDPGFVDRMAQNVQEVLHKMVQQQRLTWRKDEKGEVWFQKNISKLH